MGDARLERSISASEMPDHRAHLDRIRVACLRLAVCRHVERHDLVAAFHHGANQILQTRHRGFPAVNQEYRLAMTEAI
jgi:hypothetical protein